MEKEGSLYPAQEPENQEGSEGDLVVAREQQLVVGEETIDKLLEILSGKTQLMTEDQRIDDIRKRQQAVSRFLLPGGADFLQMLFDKARELNISLNFSMLDLGGYILAGLRIEGPNFEKLTFSEADFTGANIQGSRFVEAVGPSAIFTDAVVTGSDFRSAVIPRMNARGARFIGCDFTATIMPDIEIDERTNFTGCIFKGTYMQRVPIERANLSGVRNHGIIR